MKHRERARSQVVRPLAVAAAVLASTAAGSLTATAPASAATRPALTIESSRASVTFTRHTYTFGDGDGGTETETDIEGDLGVSAVADLKQPFEVRATRKDYASPIVARLVRDGKDWVLPSPADWDGLTGFSTTTYRNAKGAVVSNETSAFCPNAADPVRRSPKAPGSSHYPVGCNGNPYSIGAVWGLQAGYATSLSGGRYAWDNDLPDLPVGTYTATTTVARAYQQALHIPAAKASATVAVTVVQAPEQGECAGTDCLAAARTRAQARVASGRAAAAPARLSGKKVKPSGPLPDLRALPAWGIVVERGRYLDFSATVWNAGPGALVVDGFRDTSDPDLMNAYQYFYSASGKQKGYAPAGGMEWDARDGHQHWHFKDFAVYQLLDAKKKFVVRSGKEAFCLANTDAIDYTVKGANWRPDNTDLHTSCGERESLGVREVLDAGSGDTYGQYLPGQSFDLSGLANGTYYIQIVANPEKVLYERRTSNNASLRKVVIGGTAGHRTVTADPIGVVVEPPVYDEDDPGADTRTTMPAHR